uniref:Adenylate kinase 7b n=1 Tax=Salarias fasciatus TaxID=181472 RepID=A0A672I329_SALFA
MGKSKQAPRRVFINRIDSYASRNIAKVLLQFIWNSLAPFLRVSRSVLLTESGGFQVVGTVSDQSEEEWPFVLEKYFVSRSSNGDLLAKLLSCDVVIYNISQHADQVEEGFWAASALHNEMGHFSKPKVFILISTVMTWACSKSPGPDEPELLTDESFRSRKAHRNFKTHIDLEKKVVKLGKTNKAVFSTYVVASGLQYGMGEQVFHYFFKTSWMGEEHEIPVFGDGNNFVPTIHISDLARVVQNVIEHRPEPQYLLAVDSSSCTLGDIVKAVAAELGPGKICKKPFEEAFLIKDLSVMEIDSMLVNLRLSAAHIETLFSINWLCQSGLVENIDLVVKEYRQERELLPVRVCVLGPPAVGKSTACKAICEHYRLHYISLKDAEIIPQVALTHPMLNEKLQSNPCRNQGFVLDGFPETYEQAKEFFYGETHTCTKKSVYTEYKFVLCLDASDDFLIDRVINLPESVVQKHNYEQEHFLRRVAEYRKNADADPVINYFLEMDVAPLHLGDARLEPDWGLLMQKVYDTLGQPKNYSSTREEEEEEELRKAEEGLRREAQDKEEEERWKEEEGRCREARWKEWKQEVVRQQEEELLEAQSLSTRNYLLEHVMPTLTQGLAECCAVRPENPVEFLAEYLFKNNPSDY